MMCGGNRRFSFSVKNGLVLSGRKKAFHVFVHVLEVRGRMIFGHSFFPQMIQEHVDFESVFSTNKYWVGLVPAEIWSCSWQGRVVRKEERKEERKDGSW